MRKGKIAAIKKNLISQLEDLRSQYPECPWLKECINMNQSISQSSNKKIKGTGEIDCQVSN
jgi:hypothetical protein